MVMVPESHRPTIRVSDMLSGISLRYDYEDSTRPRQETTLTRPEVQSGKLCVILLVKRNVTVVSRTFSLSIYIYNYIII